MGTINDLNTVDTLADDDKFVIWQKQAGATRAITAVDMAAYFGAELSDEYQPLDATLTAAAALGFENRKLWRGTGVDTAANVTSGDLFDVINVRDPPYLAKGDGTTNDTAAFVAALATGKNVVVPPGTYIVTVDTIEMATTGQTMIGLVPVNRGAEGGAILKTTGTTGTIVEVSAQACVIKSICFELSGTYTNLVAIKGQKVTNTDDLDLTVQDCRFINCTTWIYAIGRGLFAFDNVGAGGTGIEKCIIREWPASGVINSGDFQDLPYGFRKDMICRNYPHSATTFVSVEGADSIYYRGMITNNMCDNGASLFIGGFADLVLADNYVKHASSTIVRIDANSTGLTMTGNVLSGTPADTANSPAYILWLDGVTLSDSVISGNTMEYSDGSTIYFDGNLDGVLITGNTLIDWRLDNSGSDGAIATGASRTWTDVAISGNVFRAGTNSDNPIRFGASQTLVNTVVKGNTWDKATYARIYTGTYTDNGSNDVEGRGSGDWKVLAQSGVAVPLTGGTSETALATVAMPGGTMGPNGNIRITTLWSMTNNANNKTARVRLGGVSGDQVLAAGLTSQASAQIQRTVWNRNSEASQVSWVAATANSYTASTATGFTATVNTANAQDIVISGQLANGADTMTLEGYLIEYQYKA